VLDVGIITTVAMMVVVSFSISASPVFPIIGTGVIGGGGGCTRREKGGEETRTSIGEILCEFTKKFAMFACGEVGGGCFNGGSSCYRFGSGS